MTIYTRSGMMVQAVLVDMEFENTIDKLIGDVVLKNSIAK